MAVNPQFSVGRWLDITYQSNVADIRQLTKENRCFHMIVPRRYIINSFIRFTLIELVLAFCSFGYFLIAELPTFAFVCLRFRIFTKQMKTFGLSAKRLWFCFAAVYVIFFIACFFLRRAIFSLIY